MSDKVTISDQRAFLIATLLRDQAEVLDERAESEHSAFALETIKRAASCRNMADDLEAAALALAPAASSGAETGVLALLPRWEAWQTKWWIKANEEMSQYALGVTAVLGDCLDDLRRVLDIPEDEPTPAPAGAE